MANTTVESPQVTTSSTDFQFKTLSDMRKIYRTIRSLWALKGAEKEFVSRYGSEKKWLSQFKCQPYDGRDIFV